MIKSISNEDNLDNIEILKEYYSYMIRYYTFVYKQIENKKENPYKENYMISNMFYNYK